MQRFKLTFSIGRLIAWSSLLSALILPQWPMTTITKRKEGITLNLHHEYRNVKQDDIDAHTDVRCSGNQTRNHWIRCPWRYCLVIILPASATAKSQNQLQVSDPLFSLLEVRVATAFTHSSCLTISVSVYEYCRYIPAPRPSSSLLLT